MSKSTQSREGDIEVKVSGGFSRDQQVATSDFKIVDHSSPDGKHEHIVISASGDVIHDTTGSASDGGGGSGK